MKKNVDLDRIPVITETEVFEDGNIALVTILGKRYTYNYGGSFDVAILECHNHPIKAFKEFLTDIPNMEERKAVMMEEFRTWEHKVPDFEFAAWLIQEYKAVDIHWQHDQWKLQQAAKGKTKSWEQLVKERDEEIRELRSELQEKDVIIRQKTKEHDDYVVEHGHDTGDGSDWLMKVNNKDIHLKRREFVIVMYVMIRKATGEEKLTANQKRLIGSYNTVDTYINQLKKDGTNPLTSQEQDNIRKVLNDMHISYTDILKDYL